MRRTSGQPVANLVAQNAANAAVLVAQAVLSIVSEGRWARTPMAQAAYADAVDILALSAEATAVSEASIHEARVAAMAQKAHAVVQLLRHDVGAGVVLVSEDVVVLLAPQIEDVLVPAYAIVMI